MGLTGGVYLVGVWWGWNLIDILKLGRENATKGNWGCSFQKRQRRLGRCEQHCPQPRSTTHLCKLSSVLSSTLESKAFSHLPSANSHQSCSKLCHVIHVPASFFYFLCSVVVGRCRSKRSGRQERNRQRRRMAGNRLK